MRRIGLLGLVVSWSALALACGGDPSNGGGGSGDPAGGGDGNKPGDPGHGHGHPSGQTITLTLDAFDVQPGTERQVCQRFNLPINAPIDVVHLHSIMSGTSHHFNAYKMMGADPTAKVSPDQAKVHDCAPASEQVSGGAAYIYGSASPEKRFDLPAGVAFHLLPGHQIILEQHVINASNAVIQGQVSFDLTGAAPGEAIAHHADIMWFANWLFYLPPGQKTSSTAHCAVPYDVELFGLWSHFHSLGAHFAMEKWTPQGTTHLYDSDDWQHPVYLPLSTPLPLLAGEGIQWTCTWNNTRQRAVTPGKNSTDEMCIAFGAAYPRAGLEGNAIQCNTPL